MKKLLAVALTALTIALISTVLTTSATSTDPVDQLIPADSYAVIKITPTAAHQQLQDLYTQGISLGMENGFLPDELSDNIATSQLTLGMVNIETEIYEGYTSEVTGYFALIEMTEGEFNTVLTEMGEDLITTTLDSGENLYQPGLFEATYFMYKDDYIVLASYAEVLEEILSLETSIATDSTYTKIQNKFLDDNLISIYINFGSVIDQYSAFLQKDLHALVPTELDVEDVPADYSDYTYTSTSAYDAFEYFGMSINQTSEGFSFQSYVETDSSILADIGIDYTGMSGFADLYNYMPSESPIFYVEGFNLAKTWESLINMGYFDIMDVSVEEMESSFQDEFGISLSAYILPLFEKGVGFLVQNNGEWIPAFTFLLDIEGNELTAAAALNAIFGSLLETADSEEDITAYEFENGDYTTLTIEVEPEDTDNPYATQIPEDMLTYNITYGVTDEGYLLVSTNKDITEDYGQGLMQDSDFSDVFDAEGREITSISYINLNNVADYTDGLLTKMAELNPEDTEIEEAKDAINNFLSVFTDIYGRGLKTNDYTESLSVIRLDFEGIAEMWTNMMEAFEEAPESYSTYKNSQVDFEDVPAEEWYGDDVYYLTTEGVITGYEDETYKPANEITRAEFITMMMRALEDKGYYVDQCASVYGCMWETGGFSDIYAEDWYAEYVYSAQMAGIVEGYEDGTFKPNNLITRAEAVQMVYNAIESVEIGASTVDAGDFSDVSESDWYYAAVRGTSEYAIVEGVEPGKFEPLRNINRAESARIIRKGLEIIVEAE